MKHSYLSIIFLAIGVFIGSFSENFGLAMIGVSVLFMGLAAIEA